MSDFEMDRDTTRNDRPRVQLHLVLPYKANPVQNPRIKRYLDRGYRIEQLQRVTDREAVVTLGVPAPVTS